MGEWGARSIWSPAPNANFRKMHNSFSKDRVKRWSFVIFDIIISHKFSGNFIETPQAVQKIWRPFLSILAIFSHFQPFFYFFGISLLRKKNGVTSQQMMSAFFFTLSIPQIDCSTIGWIYIDIRLLVLLEISRRQL